MSSAGRDTEQRILDAAWRLFERRGHADVRLEDIARAARLSRQAVYLHFAGRADLLVRLVEHIQARLGVPARLARIDGAASGAGMLDELVRFSADYTPLMYPFARALDAIRRHDPAAAAAWDARLQSRLARARAIARRLHVDGRLARGVTVAVATDLIWTMTSIATWEDLVVRRRWTARRYAAWIRTALVQTLLAGR
jgi:AcrR family transcriptional regulator